jgi:hypothetical protein
MGASRIPRTSPNRAINALAVCFTSERGDRESEEQLDNLVVGESDQSRVQEAFTKPLAVAMGARIFVGHGLRGSWFLGSSMAMRSDENPASLSDPGFHSSTFIRTSTRSVNPLALALSSRRRRGDRRVVRFRGGAGASRSVARITAVHQEETIPAGQWKLAPSVLRYNLSLSLSDAKRVPKKFTPRERGLSSVSDGTPASVRRHSNQPPALANLPRRSSRLQHVLKDRMLVA